MFVEQPTEYIASVGTLVFSRHSVQTNSLPKIPPDTYSVVVQPAQVVLADCSGDFACFYERAEELGELDEDERAEAMQQLLERHSAGQS